MADRKRQRRSFITEVAGIAKDSSELLDQSESLQSGLTTLLETYAAKEEACNKAVKYVQQHYDEIMDGAELQAEQLLQDAEVRASAIIAEAEEQVEAWNAEKARLANIQAFLPKVKLDVGGIKYTTSLTTLRRFPDTMIGAMFSGRHALPLDEEGYHFIDRDGTHFRLILNFLRSPETFVLDIAGSARKELKSECEYYGIADRMFPFEPIEPFQIRIKYGFSPKLVSIAQDQNGVYTCNGVPVEVCLNCYTATIMENGIRLQTIHYFNQEVAVHGGILSPAQPTPLTTCNSCGNAET